MSVEVISRPPRRDGPPLPDGEVTIDAPPALAQPGQRQITQMMMMLPMVAGGGAMALMYSSASSGPVQYVVGGLFAVSALGMGVVGFTGSGGVSRRDMAVARRRYLRHLAQHRIRVRRTVAAQHAALTYLHPEPAQLWTIAASRRLWERRRSDADFAIARLGTGPQPLATRLVPPATVALEELEPLSAAALRRFVTTYSTVPALPVAMALAGFGRVYMTGEPGRVRAMARAVVAQLATLQAPDDLLVAAVVDGRRRPAWEWLKWLPHAQHPTKSDGLGAVRLVVPGIGGLEAMLDETFAHRPRFDPAEARPVDGPHVVVVLDGGDPVGSDHLLVGGGVEGVTVLDLSTPPPRLLDRGSVVLDVAADGALRTVTADGAGDLGVADGLSGIAAEALARQLAPLRLSAASAGEERFSVAFGLAELLDLGDPHQFDPRRTWVARPNRDQLRVRFGLQADGTPIELDLKESAQDGMGPHGLLIGATGSGKSELLRTLVLALAVTHSSDSLNFALVDFKGGATFAKLDRLPHTSAVITNLAEELTLVDRMTDAINGELLRRQELLRRSGNFTSLRDYERARAAGAALAEVPTLLVICDEFSELLSAKPDFIDMFVQIGRVGRSLGVHLLLASQKLDEGRLRGLDSHLSYRIGLRTFSAMESRIVLGTADAYELPRAPGHGYLKIDTESMQRFRSAYVSGVYRRSAPTAAGPGRGAAADVAPYTAGYVSPPVEPDRAAAEPAEGADAVGETLLDILVERMEGRGRPAHQIWLPPLAAAPTLAELLPGLVIDPARGLSVPPGTAGTADGLRATIGLVDRPLEQRRESLVLDLSAGAGHLAVVGGPRSGKSTALATAVAALALAHTPREVQFYCLDFGGGTLAALRGLPHVGGVSGRLDPGAVRRTVAEVLAVLTTRERAFATRGVDSMATYRTRRAAGEFADDPFGDVFLVVDGWSSIRADFEELEPALVELATRGLAYGVHLMVACSRWYDLRGNVRDLFGSQVELRLGDPSDSMVNRRTAISVPVDQPGRGLTSTGHHMILARPALDGDLAALAAHSAQAWPAPGAPAVRMLPPRVTEADLASAVGRLAGDGAPRPSGLPIALAESDLGPAYHDFAEDPHLLVFGDAQSGKSGFLRALGRTITSAGTSEQVQLLVVDYRRSLTGALPASHLGGAYHDARAARGMAEDLAPVLRQRLEGPWRGPRVYLLVDDYELVAGMAGNPLEALLDVLAQARDIGFHMIVARRSGGAGRALFEPMLQQLRELGTPGVVLSGNRDEGPLLGAVKPSVQPAGRGWLVGRRGDAQMVQLVVYPAADIR